MSRSGCRSICVCVCVPAGVRPCASVCLLACAWAHVYVSTSPFHCKLSASQLEFWLNILRRGRETLIEAVIHSCGGHAAPRFLPRVLTVLILQIEFILEDDHRIRARVRLR